MFECEIIQTNERKFAGFSFSGAFPQSFPAEAVNVQQRLGNRKAEFTSTVNTNVLYSPYCVVDGLATYWACYQIQGDDPVPEGMTVFKLPGHRYAKVNCTNKTISEGYSKLFEWIGQNGIKLLANAYSMEIFYIKEIEEEPVELLIPIEDQV